MMSTNMPETPTQGRGGRQRDFVKFQSTPDGDVRTITVEPSFDAEDGRVESVQLPKLGDEAGANDERLERRHSSHLSAHFFDATNLSDDPAAEEESAELRGSPVVSNSSKNNTTRITPASSADDPALPSPSTHEQVVDVRTCPSERDEERMREGSARDSAQPTSYPYPPPQTSPHVGQKHRRVFSGGVANPLVAHRRINSSGNTAIIDRQDGTGGSYRSSGFRRSPPTSLRNSPKPKADHRRGSGGGRHHREDSAGLDMLSAAADVSKEVLAEAAGAPPPPPASSAGRRGVDRFNVSPTQFSSSAGGTSSPSRYYGRNGWASGPNPHPPPSTSNEPSGHSAQQQPPSPRHPRYLEPNHPPPHHRQRQEHHHHHQQQQYYPPPPPTYYAAPRGGAPPPGAPGSYPVQYATGYHHGGSHKPLPPPGVQLGVSQHHPPPPSRRHDSRGSDGGSLSVNRIDTDENLFSHRRQAMPPPPAGWNKDRGGGTIATTGTGAMRPSATQHRPEAVVSMPPEESGHHRKMSSFSSLGAFLGNGPLFPEADSSGPGQRGGQSSSVVYYEEGTEDLDTADALLQQLSRPPMSQPMPRSKSPARAPAPAPPPRRAQAPVPNKVVSGQPPSTPLDDTKGGRQYMTGGISKRVRRKCTVGDCSNRVVQGGLCIAHGAKRKQCSHPGCTKNVKKAGLCSTHGPARKRCDHDGCTKVAVQGGKCISHGAKKKLCAVDGCSKQAILAGMCKKHHDQHNGVSSSSTHAPEDVGQSGGFEETDEEGPTSGRKASAPAPQFCVTIGSPPKASPEQERPRPMAGHQRGLSIFTDMSAVDSIIGDGGLNSGDSTAPPGGGMASMPSTSSEERGEVTRTGTGQSYGREVRVESPLPQGQLLQQDQRPKKGHHQRGLSIFTEESVAETIIQNPDITL